MYQSGQASGEGINIKNPIDRVKGKIERYDDDGTVLISCKYDDYFTFIKRDYKACIVQFIDNRELSNKQRNSCYAMLREISEYTGMSLGATKEYMKLKFLVEEIQETAEDIFSLSDAPMSLVCAFQRFLVKLIVEWDIPTRRPLLNFVDDIPDYVYACLINKKCCICGIPADLHHVDKVGMGRDRETIFHEGMRVLPLCREHHTEIHNIGFSEFSRRYHIIDGIALDKTLCKIYRLKPKKETMVDEK